MAVCPISLVEVNYSVFRREPEAGLLHAAGELGVGVVAFGVLANGMLTENKVAEMNDRFPQHAPAEADRHLAQVRALRAIADDAGISLPQLLTAWVLAQGDNIMALTGARTPTQLRDTLTAIGVELTQDVLSHVDAATAHDVGLGARSS